MMLKRPALISQALLVSKSKSLLLGLLLTAKVLLWPTVLLMIAIFFFGLTNAPFEVSDSEIVQDSLALVLKVLLLSAGFPTQIAGVYLQFAPLCLSGLMLILAVRFHAKYAKYITWLSSFAAWFWYAILLSLARLVDLGWEFNQFLSWDLLMPGLFGLGAVLLPCLVFQARMDGSRTAYFINTLFARFSKSDNLRKNFSRLIRFSAIVILGILVCGLGLTLINTINKWSIFVESFEALTGGDGFSMAGLILVCLMWFPNLFILNFNQVGSIFDLFNWCSNPSWCTPTLTESPLSFPIMDWVFSSDQLVFSLILAGLVMVCGIIFGYKFYVFPPAIRNNSASSSLKLMKSAALGNFILKLFSELLLILIPTWFFRTLAGVRLGTYYFSGVFSELIFISVFFFLGGLIYLLFSYLHRKFWYSGFHPN